MPVVPDSPLSNFTLSANSVGIPIVPPILPRTGFPDRQNIDSNAPSMPSHLLSGIPSYLPMPSTAYHSIPWMVDSEKSLSQGGHRSAVSSLCHDVLKASESRASQFSQEVNYKGINDDIDIDDPLGSEELSSLLPGSRKPLASGTNSYEKGLHTNTIGNGSGKSNAVENNYFINYHGAVHGEVYWFTPLH